ncbi:MAG: B12-binding domain-containing radical SAM protein [Chitinispirillaceae bacterium]|nr:B12-binding domain-containing radical SAM protein [Chitinispirillaceae bacterium]
MFVIGPHFTATGPRRIASYLKARNVAVRIVFVPGPASLPRADGAAFERSLSRFLAEDDLVGLSFFSNHLPVARTLARAIRKGLAVPIIAGGVHATAAPETCLDFCDAVCIGEGEESMDAYTRRCVAGFDGTPIAGVNYRYKGRVVEGEPRPLFSDLDNLPYQDYDIATHAVLERKRIRPMKRSDLGRNFGFSLIRIMTFGCPCKCAYCINNRYHAIYPEYGRLRRYSTDYFIAETRHLLEMLPFVRYIMIDDDAFLNLPVEVIADFCEKYKRAIDLPFAVGGMRPESVTREKLDLLIGAGLLSVRMGIQSGSARTNRDIFRRSFSKEKILAAARCFAGYNKRLRPPFYDVIVDNPWEREEDRRETLELFQELPRPYYVSAFSLTFFPGTELFEKACREKLVSGYDPAKKYHGIATTVYNLSILYSGFFRYPRWLSGMLSGPRWLNRTGEHPLPYLIYCAMNLFCRLTSYYTNPFFLRALLRRRNHR